MRLDRRIRDSLSIALGGLLMAPMVVEAQVTQLSGGIDTRYVHQDSPHDDKALVEGLFMNLRRVWSDELGDRWIGVGQADFDDNFQKIRPYQAYLQYKGPLGSWNVRAGHYLLPFGLLDTYDTERLILQDLEKISLGIRKDTGAEVFGHFGDWDYSLSMTDGLSDVRLADRRANPVLTGRLASVHDDWQVGASGLTGRVLLDPDFGIGSGFVSERRFVLDATESIGRLTARAEGVGGTDDGIGVGGGVVLADYALTDSLDINSRYAAWHKTTDQHFGGIGLTYRAARGLSIRLADMYQFQGDGTNAITLQLYYEFSKAL